MKRRFLVPVIGKISAGKSSFLNALLGETILQDGTSTTTQFMCIIRHNSNSEIPRLYKILANNTAPPNSLQLISNTNSENHSTFPSFEKGEKVAEGLRAIQLKIEEINQIMKKKIKDGTQINDDDMFYILEVKINLFDEFNIKPFFTNKFDFVDVPGLNESNTLDGKDNFNFIDYVNKKSDQIGFYIFIIDHYSLNKDVADIINNLKNKDTKNLIVITKIDQQNAHSTKKQLAEKLNVDLLKNNVSFAYSFLIKSLSSYLKTSSVSDFANVLYYSFQYYRSPQVKVIEPNLTFFAFCTKAYKSIKDKGVKVENNQIGNNSSMDNFFDDDEKEKDNEIKKNKDKIKEKVNLLMKEYGTYYIEKAIEILKNLIGDLEDCFRKNLERNFIFESYPKQCLSILDEINEMTKKINNKENAFIKYNIDNLKQEMNDLHYNQRIRIPLLGGYNVGKSSLLNAIIGKDILPVSSQECTQKGIIIRHSDQKDSALYRMKIENGFLCESEEFPIAKGNCDVIKKAIEELNKNVNKTDFFYLLTTKIEFFRFYHIDQEIRELVEFVDFPGLNTKINSPKDDNFYTLINSSKSFLFINNQDLINEKGNMEILNTLIQRIEMIKLIDTTAFYKCCIFVLNKVDEPKKINISKATASLASIFDRRKGETENAKQLMNFDEAVTFSSKNYSDLVKEYTIWTKLENTINDLYEKYKINVLDLDEEQSFIDFCLEKVKGKCEDLKIEINENLTQKKKDQSQIITFKEMIRSFDKPELLNTANDNDDINKFLQLFNLVKEHYSNQELLINSITKLFRALKEKITNAYEIIKKEKKNTIKTVIEDVSKLVEGIIYKIDHPKKDNEKIKRLRQLLMEEHFDENTRNSINQLEAIYNEIDQEYNKSNGELKKKYNCNFLTNVPEEMKKQYSNKIAEILKNYKEIQEKEVNSRMSALKKFMIGEAFNGISYLMQGEFGFLIFTVFGEAAAVIALLVSTVLGISFIWSSIVSVLSESQIREHLKLVGFDLQNNCRDAIKKLNEINKKLVAEYRKPIENELKKEEEDYSKYQEKEKQNLLLIQKKMEKIKEKMFQFHEDKENRYILFEK